MIERAELSPVMRYSFSMHSSSRFGQVYSMEWTRLVCITLLNVSSKGSGCENCGRNDTPV